jgi:hypothetical protein
MLVPLLALVLDEQPVVVLLAVERSRMSLVPRMPCVNHSLLQEVDMHSSEVVQMGQ